MSRTAEYMVPVCRECGHRHEPIRVIKESLDGPSFPETDVPVECEECEVDSFEYEIEWLGAEDFGDPYADYEARMMDDREGDSETC